MKRLVIVAVIIGIGNTMLRADGLRSRLVVDTEHDVEQDELGYPLWLEKTFYGVVFVVGGYLTWRFAIKKLDIRLGRWASKSSEQRSLAKRTRVDLREAKFPLYKVQRPDGKVHYLLATSSDLGISLDDLSNDSPLMTVVREKAEVFVTSRVDNPWLGQWWHQRAVNKKSDAFTLSRVRDGVSMDEAMEKDKMEAVEVDGLKIMKVIRDAKGKDSDLDRGLENIRKKLIGGELLGLEEDARKVGRMADGELAKVIATIEGRPDEILKKIDEAKTRAKELFSQLANDMPDRLEEISVKQTRPSDVVDFLRRQAFERAFKFKQSTVLMEEQLTRRGRKMNKEIVELSPITEIWDTELLAIEEKNLIGKSGEVITLIENANNHDDVIDYVADQLRRARQVYLGDETGDNIEDKIETAIKFLTLELRIKRSLARHEQFNLAWLGEKSEYLFNELRRKSIGHGDLLDLKLDERRVQEIFSDNVLLFIKENDNFIDMIFDKQFLDANRELIDETLTELKDARTVFKQRIALLEKLLQKYNEVGDVEKLIESEILGKTARDSKKVAKIVEGIRDGSYWQRLAEIVDEADSQLKGHGSLLNCLDNSQKSCLVYLDIAHFSFPNIKESKYHEKGWYGAEQHSLIKLLKKEGFELTPVTSKNDLIDSYTRK